MLDQVRETGSALRVLIAADPVEQQERHVAGALDGTDSHRQAVVERDMRLSGRFGGLVKFLRNAAAFELAEDSPLAEHRERERRERMMAKRGAGGLVVGVERVGVAAHRKVAGDRGAAGGRVQGERTAATRDVPADGQAAGSSPADRSAAEGVEAGAQAADSQNTQSEAAERDQAKREPSDAHNAEGTAADRKEATGR